MNASPSVRDWEKGQEADNDALASSNLKPSPKFKKMQALSNGAGTAGDAGAPPNSGTPSPPDTPPAALSPFQSSPEKIEVTRGSGFGCVRPDTSPSY